MRLKVLSQTPTQDERNALESYFYLQARLYPCGECASEFQQLLKKNPPQARPLSTISGIFNLDVNFDLYECIRHPQDERQHCGYVMSTT